MLDTTLGKRFQESPRDRAELRDAGRGGDAGIPRVPEGLAGGRSGPPPQLLRPGPALAAAPARPGPRALTPAGAPSAALAEPPRPPRSEAAAAAAALDAAPLLPDTLGRRDVRGTRNPKPRPAPAARPLTTQKCLSNFLELLRCAGNYTPPSSPKPRKHPRLSPAAHGVGDGIRGANTLNKAVVFKWETYATTVLK